jgi:enoyl-CoA hydratase/carnithine racemase
MSQYPDVLYAVKDRIATITLNRPDRLNAYTDRMAGSIRFAMADAARDPAVRVIILTGAGRGFCAGADMDLLQGVLQEGGERQASRGEGDIGDAFNSKYGPKLDDEFADLQPSTVRPRVSVLS